ncbi:esterase lipase [Aureococcus anophagefferens]|nr:esterase lipase [Aureococcus anophagefferens]
MKAALLILVYAADAQSSCADSASWHKSGAPQKDCAWVAKLAPDRCVAKADDGRLGFEGCPASCGNNAASCADDGAWHKRDDPSKDCFWGCRAACRACASGACASASDATAAPTAAAAASVWEGLLFPAGAPNAAAEGRGEHPPGRRRHAARLQRRRADDRVLARGGAAAAAVVVLPGGGYKKVALGKEGDHVAALLASRHGVDCFVVKYRVPSRGRDDDEWPSDAPLAERAGHVARPGYAVVGVAGFSAGGHLAARVGAARDRAYDRVDAVDDYGFAPDFVFLVYPSVYPWELADDNGEDAFSFDLNRDFDDLSGFPPAYLAHAADDATAPYLNSLAFFHHLRQAGAGPAKLDVVPTGGHGFGACSTGETGGACGWTDRAFAFLRRDAGLAV